MPRDYQLLLPWTQQLLRLARSSKLGVKRKPTDLDDDDGKPDDVDGLGADGKAGAGQVNALGEDRGYVAKKWKPVPEALLEPEHKHFEFLAKRRKGLPSLYAPEVRDGPIVPMRKTRVSKTGPDGEVTVYEVLVPEGQVVEGEVTEESKELASIQPVAAAPGTAIPGLGVANEAGILVAETLLQNPVAPRRNRPPPKKKGGPGRGKKRVTFTNPDGTTYTTIVPNATKIVPEPGQTVTHVAKGEEARADVTAEEAAAQKAKSQEEGGADGEEGGDEGEEGEGSDEDGDEGDDDDREEGELSDEDAEGAGVTPVPGEKVRDPVKAEGDVKMEDAVPTSAAADAAPPPEEKKDRDASSSPDLPLAKDQGSRSHSRQGSLVEPAATIENDPKPEPVGTVETTKTTGVAAAPAENGEVVESVENVAIEQDIKQPEDGEEDLLGNLEKSLETTAGD